eukprot:g24458.t1
MNSDSKKIRRNARVLGIPLDLRGQVQQATLPVPVRNILGDVICPADLQGVQSEGLHDPKPAVRLEPRMPSDAGPATAVTAPLTKVVRGGA